MNDGASIGVVLTDWRAEEKLLYLLRLRVCMQHIAVLYTLQDRRTLHYTLFYRVLWRSPTRGPRNPPGVVGGYRFIAFVPVISITSQYILIH